MNTAAPSNSVAISDDGQSVLSSSDDDTLILWSIANDNVTPRVVFSGHQGDVNVGYFMPDGNTIVSASDDLSIILWDRETGEVLRRFEGNPAPITGFAINTDGTRMATTFGDQDRDLAPAENQILLWNLGQIDDLAQWARDNRFVRALTPAECNQFDVPGCG